MANIDDGFSVNILVLGNDDGDQVLIAEGGFDPSAGLGYDAPIGSLFLRYDIPTLYLKTGVADTGWSTVTAGATDELVKTSSGDGTAGFLVDKLVGGAGLTLTESSGGNRTITLDYSDFTRVQTVYVGKHGNDSNDGLAPTRAKLTFGSAITAATALVPSTSNRISIICEDGGTYTESFTIPSWVMIKAPNATFVGNTTISDDAEFVFQEIVAATGNAITKTGSATGWATGEIVRATGTANGVVNTATTSILIVRVRQIYSENGTGILDLSNGAGHIHMDVEDMYITGAGTAVDRQSNDGIIVGRISHILEKDGGVGNGTALDITDGRMNLNVGTIETTVAYSVAGSGQLDLIVNDITPTAQRIQLSGLAEVNVIQADSLRWRNRTASFTARRTEFVAINTTSAPVTMTLPNPASNGDSVTFQDALNTFSTNNLTVDAGVGGLIDDGGAGSQTIVLDVSGTAGVFIYNTSISRWTLSRIQEQVAFSPDNVIYVTKNGSDTIGDGSFSNPYLTVKKGVTEALAIATTTNPTTVKVLDGIYDEANPINITGATAHYVQIQGSESTSTFIRPNVNGQPLFNLESTVDNNGPTLSRLTAVGKNNGGTDYRDVVGGSLIRVSGNGTFLIEQVNAEQGYIGLDAGNGTITTSQRINWNIGTAALSTFNIDAKSSANVNAQLFTLGDPLTTSLVASDTAEVDISNYTLCGDVTELTQNGNGVVANDASNIFLNGGLIHSHVVGIQANGTSTIRVASTEFANNTTDFDQASTTASVQIQGKLSKTKQLIADGANVSLNYIDSDTGDYIVGSAESTGNPGKEFRVRDSDGRTAIGDNATDANMADGAVGGGRTLNVIDTNGNMRIWRYVTVAGQDPALEFLKGTTTTADGAGRPGGPNPGDPAADVAAGTGTVWWDMFLQESDYMVVRRRTSGGGSEPNEKIRVYQDHSEFLGATVYDDSDNAMMLYLQSFANAVNYVQINNTITGSGPEIRSAGTDTNIDIQMVPKGTGTVIVPAGYENNIVDQSLITKAYFDANAIKQHLSRHNGAVTQTFTTTLTTINFATSIRNDAAFTHATVGGGSEITINQTGWYEITYDVSLDAPVGNARTTSQTELQLNGTLVAGTRSWGYHRTSGNAEDSMSATIKLNLTSGDVIRVQSVRVGGGDALVTLANGCRLNIQSIDAP